MTPASRTGFVDDAAGERFAGDRDFALVNHTGHSIREIYIAAAHTREWGDDRLAADATLANDKSLSLKLGDRASCLRDMKVVFDDDAYEAVWEKLDLCKIDKLSLMYNRATMKVNALQE